MCIEFLSLISITLHKHKSCCRFVPFCFVHYFFISYFIVTYTDAHIFSYMATSKQMPNPALILASWLAGWLCNAMHKDLLSTEKNKKKQQPEPGLQKFNFFCCSTRTSVVHKIQFQCESCLWLV